MRLLFHELFTPLFDLLKCDTGRVRTDCGPISRGTRLHLCFLSTTPARIGTIDRSPWIRSRSLYSSWPPRSSELTCISVLPSDVSMYPLTPLLVPARRVGKPNVICKKASDFLRCDAVRQLVICCRSCALTDLGAQRFQCINPQGQSRNDRKACPSNRLSAWVSNGWAARQGAAKQSICSD